MMAELWHWFFTQDPALGSLVVFMGIYACVFGTVWLFFQWRETRAAHLAGPVTCECKLVWTRKDQVWKCSLCGATVCQWCAIFDGEPLCQACYIKTRIGDEK